MFNHTVSRAATTALIATAVLAAPSTLAGTTTVAADIPGAVVFDIFRDSGVPIPFGPVTVATPNGDVTITSTSERLANGFIEDPAVVGLFQYPPSIFGSLLAPIDPAVAPGDYTGIFEVNEILTLNFDVPLAAVGTTLYSNVNGIMSTGSTVTAYTGPDATGSTVGTVTTPDNPIPCCPTTDPRPHNFLYFAGITGEGQVIRSITITPTVPGNGYGLDAIVIAPASGPTGCNIADVAEPLGTLDIDDVLSFLAAFADGNPLADIAEPTGTLDIDDVLTFLGAFATGCP